MVAVDKTIIVDSITANGLTLHLFLLSATFQKPSLVEESSRMECTYLVSTEIMNAKSRLDNCCSRRVLMFYGLKLIVSTVAPSVLLGVVVDAKPPPPQPLLSWIKSNRTLKTDNGRV